MCNTADKKKHIPVHSMALTRFRLQPPLADIQSRPEPVKVYIKKITSQSKLYKMFRKLKCTQVSHAL